MHRAAVGLESDLRLKSGLETFSVLTWTCLGLIGIVLALVSVLGISLLLNVVKYGLALDLELVLEHGVNTAKVGQEQFLSLIGGTTHKQSQLAKLKTSLRKMTMVFGLDLDPPSSGSRPGLDSLKLSLA